MDDVFSILIMNKIEIVVYAIKILNVIGIVVFFDYSFDSLITNTLILSLGVRNAIIDAIKITFHFILYFNQMLDKNWCLRVRNCCSHVENTMPSF
ncbi:hypothetical protein BpHYR1_022543 [Brachionus plicatilis]|uniref:Uncharacterized protein n=1 Tax=Brachionus plicatilis TaxID=10195 RepID=A0A3M7QLS6_BRAPC|nr:hypothetical protein BpHYR1_022543 [Brachionus plicatilis]